MSAIQKVEIVTPAIAKELAPRTLVRLLVGLALRVLVVWWFVATWFPEQGLTYWGLVLPVWIASWIFRGGFARHIPEKKLFRQRYDHGHGMVEEEVFESLTDLHEEAKK